ncbi:uncharacterized protein [Primulina eburnea]|uniref:uncharacterized protein n=1 Tax=Primulina eburnea TaxID=1245227 RepID=UPI003C6CB914
MMSAHVHTISTDRKEIPHFSHDHPLIYTEDENPRSLCSACGVALLSGPSYRCSKDCNFFLHQPCSKLDPSSNRMFGSDPYDLKLLAKPLNENCKCEKCGKLCTKFTYECLHWYHPSFYLHCQCAFPLEINIEHISHHEHSLVALCKEASLLCDACGREQKGIFFSCPKCSFHIHQDCCLLPTVAKINHHRHLLALNYSLSKSYLSDKNCLICKNKISLSFGAYICQLCDSGAHLNCAASELEEPAIVQGSILPRNPDTFPSLIIRALIESREDIEIKDGGESKIEKYHSDHSSWKGESDNQLVCNACIQPIISPHLSHYSCPQSPCDFLLHQICANLPPSVEGYFRNEPLDFFSESTDFCSIFSCEICEKRCNGFGYREKWWAVIDAECVAAPTTIKHISHSPHLLALTVPWNAKYLCCGGADFSYYAYSYICSLCDYYIHVSCAFLPKTAEHKFDEHPLDLIYDPILQIPHKEDEEKQRHYLCEFCEEDVNPKFWFYYCGKCDQSFHVNCIPSTGKLSKIKFGRKIDLPRHVHDHPVALTRMLTMGSQRCGSCQAMIQGFIDDMAFHCSMCDFWIHFQCARDKFLPKKMVNY